MTIFTASVHYRAEKHYGYGRTAHERHTRIVPGYRAEVISGLDDGQFCYTGVCATKQDAIAELIGQLKARGISGKLRVV